MNPLTLVTDYQSMLNRIFWFSFAAALVSVCILRTNVDAIETLLAEIDLLLETDAGFTLPLPGGYLLPALLVGLAARIFRVHSHVAHWLGIRERFDLDVIIAELARRSGIQTDADREDTWQTNRHEIMRTCFYRHVSGPSPSIDEHLVHQALDLWSWFWIGLETSLLFFLTGLLLLAGSSYTAGALVLSGAIGFALVGLPLIRHQCKQYALAQVKVIMSDPTRAAAIRQTLGGVTSPDQPLKRAA